jgi:hypothetical protein
VQSRVIALVLNKLVPLEKNHNSNYVIDKVILKMYIEDKLLWVKKRFVLWFCDTLYNYTACDIFEYYTIFRARIRLFVDFVYINFHTVLSAVI